MLNLSESTAQASLLTKFLQKIAPRSTSSKTSIVIVFIIVVISTGPVLSSLEQNSVLLTEETNHGNRLKDHNKQHKEEETKRTLSSSVVEGTIGKTTQQKIIFGSGVAGYLVADATDKKLNESNEVDAILVNVLERNGPDMRPLREFRDFDDITLSVAKRAWQLMHEHAKVAATDRLSLVEPIIVQTLEAANVSLECLVAAQNTIKAAQELQSWAVQLLTSWGNFPPTGFLEGTLGDIGSFHGCVNVPDNPIIKHAHYCTISYRPVMPVRRNYDLIIKQEPNELLNLFEPIPSQASSSGIHDEYYANELHSQDGQQTLSKITDTFTEILSHAQYSHYVYYKYGTCFPIQCTPNDVHKIAKLLGKRSILMSGPVKCHSNHVDDYEEKVPKSSGVSNNSSTSLQISTRDLNNGIYIWKPHMTEAQWVALLIISSVTLFIIFSTLVDIFINRLPNLYHRLKIAGSFSNTGCLNKIKNNYSTANTQLSIEMRYNLHHESSFLTHGKPQETNNNSTSDITRIEETRKKLSSPIKLNDESNGITSRIPHNVKDSDTIKDRSTTIQGNDQTKIRKFRTQTKKHRSLFMEIVDDYSIITSIQQFFSINQCLLKKDISCINGIRCITMSWIIITHTMQYNDWSAFARIYEVENHLKSLINQPLFNGSYLVDTFFLVSGLLTSFSSFKSTTNGGLSAKFSARSYLIGRYLRLTPQIMFISMLFILLPQLSRSGGPHWYTMTGEYSENCSQNWWVNLFHIQAFYRSNEMCNFVCWWISVDMFYHLFALAIILIVYYTLPRSSTKASNGRSDIKDGPRATVNFTRTDSTTNSDDTSKADDARAKAKTTTLLSCIILILSYAVIQAIKHYQLELPPNLLSTIPQTGAMWSEMTLKFFWTPYPHAFPFFFGFYIGYLMAQYQIKLTNWFNLNRASIGWTLAITLIVIQSYSTYFWVIGKWRYTRLTSTIFSLICPVVWSSCLTWIILACQYGYGSWINQLLSCRLFIILGKASYIVYLSHFLVLFTFFGSQNLLLEPTRLMMSYVILGNICLSMILGSVLCVVYEIPWLKTQKRLMKYIG